MSEIKVLQLGEKDWSRMYSLPEIIDFQYATVFDEKPSKPYDIVFLDRTPLEEEIGPLHKACKAYTLFITERVELKGNVMWLYKSRKGRRIASHAVEQFLNQEARNYFPRPYGEKFQFKNLSISQNFTGRVRWYGNHSVCLQGEYGTKLSQIAFWRNNIPVFQGQAIDLWLEYKKDDAVSIALTVTQFVQGSISDVQQKWEFSEEELERVVRIDNGLPDGLIFVSLQASGEGELQIVALHDRYSRRGHGHFLPGGERYVTSDREEIFCYFDPGDMKPPLNVYFSGYKTMEGFEGYNLMRSMGSPFLLIAEARLEGGCFYLGSAEYERILKKAVYRYMAELGFRSEQVIFSGLSMGTFGALYYGCDIRPHALILGKPLASIGDIAANERLLRPGGFPTSLDVVRYLGGNMERKTLEEMNDRLWNKFDRTDWNRTKFIVSYMIEDDYDPTAYKMLISRLQSEDAQLYGKGIHGRHNDNTGAIVQWFSGQFEKILWEDFRRKAEG